jgi:lipid-A-disaccharide synthase-like uncharacterized protein
MSSWQPAAATRPERRDPAALVRWALVGLAGEALFTISWIVTRAPGAAGLPAVA